MKKGIITAIIAVIIIGSCIATYILIETKPQARMSKKEIRKLGVKAYEEYASDYKLDVTYPAKVVAQEQVALGVEVSGKIEKGSVPLKAGQSFRKGDLLFSINDSDMKAKLISSKSKFITLLSQILPDIRIDFGTEYPKWQSFFDKIKLDEKMPALPEFSSSKEKVYMASKNLISSYYDIDAQEILASKYHIYAPFNGVFTSVTKEVGAIATANSQLGTISSTDNLEIIASVAQDEADRVKIGDKVLIKARGDNNFYGTLSRISSYIEGKTQMVDVYITIYEPTRKIIEGEMLNVVIPIGELKNVIKLPSDAVGNDGLVYGVKDGKIYSINAKLEYVRGEWAYISGVKDGEVLVQESIITPKEGLEVNVLSQHIE